MAQVFDGTMPLNEEALGDGNSKAAKLEDISLIPSDPDEPDPGVSGKRRGEDSNEAMAVALPGDKFDLAAVAAVVSASTASTASSSVGSSSKLCIEFRTSRSRLRAGKCNISLPIKP